jgi:ATP-binding cassette, subfamily B, bacterial
MSQFGPQEEEFQGNLNLPLWRKIFRYARPYKRFLLPLFFVGLVNTTCEVILLPFLTMSAINEATENGLNAAIRTYAIFYFILAAVVGACTLLFVALGGKVSTGVSHDMRRDAFAKLQELSFSYYDTRPVGWLLSRVTSDCDRLSRLLGWGVLDLTWGFLGLAGIAVFLFATNWWLALLVFTVLPPLAVVCRIFQRRMLLTSRATRRINSILTGAYNEALMGVRTTKTLVREQQNLAEFRGLSGQMYQASLRNALQGAMFWPQVMILGVVGQSIALWAGGDFVLHAGLKIGVLAIFVLLAQRFFEPVMELSRIMTDILGAQAAAERVQGLLDTVTDIKDSPEVAAAIAARREASIEGWHGHPLSGDHEAVRDSWPRNDKAWPCHPPAADGMAEDGLPDRIDRIEFRNVTFAYKNGQTILERFNLTVEAGQTIALVGPTGGGKTTIVSLACRFYEPTGGEILIDGIDYRRRSLHWLQSKLGIVLQSPHLFAGTVRENIAYGNLAATDDQIRDAARLASCHDFIMAMDHGYDSQVGPGGNRLSTGQKQLVALARSILADPRIFIMDEATSSVDTETERLIQRGVERVLKGRTSFVIAHRLSTIRSADRILVIEKGRIVEEGTHLDLVRLKGKYYRLYTSQFAREREDDLLRGQPGTATA